MPTRISSEVAGRSKRFGSLFLRSVSFFSPSRDCRIWRQSDHAPDDHEQRTQAGSLIFPFPQQRCHSFVIYDDLRFIVEDFPPEILRLPFFVSLTFPRPGAPRGAALLSIAPPISFGCHRSTTSAFFLS